MDSGHAVIIGEGHCPKQRQKKSGTDTLRESHSEW